jgi:hypothetical protein
LRRDLPTLELVEGDALDADWHELGGPDALIAGNIPYNITSPLLDKALMPPRPRRVVFLVQKEVADRVSALPGSDAYGALSVGVQAVATGERLFIVPAGAFKPRPKVDSAVLRLTPRETAALRSALPMLEERGFRIEPFGRDTYAVTAVPIVLRQCEDAAAIHEAIADLLHDEAREATGIRERVTRIVACRGALKAGTVVTREQCRRLIEQLGRTETPYTCPHGRPTVIRYTKAQLDALFKRT